MSDLDVVAIKAEHEKHHEVHFVEDLPQDCCACGLPEYAAHRCLPYRLAVALERAQAASAGVDMLVAQAERRGAAKALWKAAGHSDCRPDRDLLSEWADAIENGADL